MNTLNTSSVTRLPLGDLVPPPERHFFGTDHLEGLADLMRAHGLVTPITVKRDNNKYVIVDGMRRYLAAKLLGWRTIDVTVREP